MVLIKKLSTGEVTLFNKQSRELIVVPSAHAKGASDWDAAMRLVAANSALHLDKARLAAVSEALKHVVLLGA